MPIYLIRAGDDGPVCITFCTTQVIDARLRRLQRDCLGRLNIIQVFRGGLKQEAALHLKHADRRVVGKWFLLADVDLGPSVTQSPSHKRTDRNAEIVRQLLTGGVTMTDVAKDFGITRERVRQIAKKGGLTGRALGSWAIAGARKNKGLTVARAEKIRRAKDANIAARAKLREKIVALFLAGMSRENIAKLVGHSVGSVSRYLIAAGHRKVAFKARPGHAAGAGRRDVSLSAHA